MDKKKSKKNISFSETSKLPLKERAEQRTKILYDWRIFKYGSYFGYLCGLAMVTIGILGLFTDNPQRVQMFWGLTITSLILFLILFFSMRKMKKIYS